MGNRIKYHYEQYRGRWRVYDSNGRKVDEFNTKDEAKERVYLLNGWQMK